MLIDRIKNQIRINHINNNPKYKYMSMNLRTYEWLCDEIKSKYGNTLSNSLWGVKIKIVHSIPTNQIIFDHGDNNVPRPYI